MGRRAVAIRLRIDARRPASWLALAGGAGAAWWSTAETGVCGPAAAIVSGAVVAAAAVGTPPREGPGSAAAWLGMRVAWPAAGAVASWLARGADVVDAGSVAVIIGAAVVTAWAIAAATSRGLAPVDATGQSLACAMASAAAAAAVAVWGAREAAWLRLPVAAAGWAGAAAAARMLRDGSGGRPVHGPLGGGIGRAIMTTSLVGMVMFLFLAPEFAPAYAGLAAAWLLAAVGPRAALGTLPAAGREPARAVRTVAAYAAVLAWPPLVAAILAGSSTAAVVPLAIAAVIVSGAGLVAGMAAGTLAAAGSRETALAVVLLTTLGAGAVGARVAAGHGFAVVRAAE